MSTEQIRFFYGAETSVVKSGGTTKMRTESIANEAPKWAWQRCGQWSGAA